MQASMLLDITGQTGATTPKPRAAPPSDADRNTQENPFKALVNRQEPEPKAGQTEPEPEKAPENEVADSSAKDTDTSSTETSTTEEVDVQVDEWVSLPEQPAKSVPDQITVVAEPVQTARDAEALPEPSRSVEPSTPPETLAVSRPVEESKTSTVAPAPQISRELPAIEAITAPTAAVQMPAPPSAQDHIAATALPPLQPRPTGELPQLDRAAEPVAKPDKNAPVTDATNPFPLPVMATKQPIAPVAPIIPVPEPEVSRSAPTIKVAPSPVAVTVTNTTAPVAPVISLQQQGFAASILNAQSMSRDTSGKIALPETVDGTSWRSIYTSSRTIDPVTHSFIASAPAGAAPVPAILTGTSSPAELVGFEDAFVSRSISEHATTVTTAPRSETFAPIPPQAAAINTQLVEAVRLRSGNSVEVSLSPEELGRVRMGIVTHDTTMVIAISADKPETMDLMRRHIEQLARDMQQLGYKDVSVEFNNDSGFSGFDKQEGRGDGSVVSSALEEIQSQEAPVTRTATTGPGGLDLRM